MYNVKSEQCNYISLLETFSLHFFFMMALLQVFFCILVKNLIVIMPSFEEEGVYCFANVLVGLSVGRPNGFL